MNSSDEDDDYDSDGENGGRGRGGMLRFLKRDTNKIKTNPKYKCIDEGSEDENAISKSNLNDDGQQSSKELQFRENFIKFESKITK